MKMVIAAQIEAIEKKLATHKIMDQRCDLEQIVERIVVWMIQKKYGNIQINFAAGRVSNVNMNESVKLTKQLAGMD